MVPTFAPWNLTKCQALAWPMVEPGPGRAAPYCRQATRPPGPAWASWAGLSPPPGGGPGPACEGLVCIPHGVSFGRERTKSVSHVPIDKTRNDTKSVLALGGEKRTRVRRSTERVLLARLLAAPPTRDGLPIFTPGGPPGPSWPCLGPSWAARRRPRAGFAPAPFGTPCAETCCWHACRHKWE